MGDVAAFWTDFARASPGCPRPCPARLAVLFGRDQNYTAREGQAADRHGRHVARRRRERGVKLNHRGGRVDHNSVLEGARDGRSVAELMRDGAHVLGRTEVMEGSPR